MKENISDSVIFFAEIAGGIAAGLSGIWWSLRAGDAVLYLTGHNLRLFFCAMMMCGLVFQWYSDEKRDRRYGAVYRICVWISGILIAWLIYGLTGIAIFDIVVLIARSVRKVECRPGSGGAFRMLLLGTAPEQSPDLYGFVWGSRIWNFENAALAAMTISFFMTVYGVIHAKRICVRSYHFPIADPGGHSCRMVHLSDLHMGSVIDRRYIHRIVSRTINLHPDYVVITGDLFNHGAVEECADLKAVEAEFRKLGACCAGSTGEGGHIFAVCGNHDPLPDDPAFVKFLEASGITLLDNQAVSLAEFELAGRTGNHLDARPLLSSWFVHPVKEKPVILLDHYPDGITEARDAGIDLMLCGHTHSGQYFPCNVLIKKKYARELRHGYSEWGHTGMIVSSGTGFFQIPIRLGTDSEIVCVDFADSTAYIDSCRRLY